MMRARTETGRGLFKMRTITRLTGLSPALLRAWESRHGIVVPLRAPKGHRLYTEDDLRVLRYVTSEIAEGRSIGEVALLGRAALLERSRRWGVVEDEPRGRSAPAPQAATPTDEMKGPLSLLRDQLVRAAVELDEGAAVRAVDAAFSRVSPDAALAEVVAPAAREIGQLWTAGRCTIAGEHLVTGILVARIRRLLDMGRARTGPLTVCSCFPDEHHELGPLFVAYQLSRHGQRVALLGANVPISALEVALERLRPANVCLSVTREPVLRAHLPALEALAHRWGERCRFFLGGEGARGDLSALEAAGVSVWRPGRPLEELAAAIQAGPIRAPQRRPPS